MSFDDSLFRRLIKDVLTSKEEIWFKTTSYIWGYSSIDFYTKDSKDIFSIRLRRFSFIERLKFIFKPKEFYEIYSNNKKDRISEVNEQ